MSIDTYAVYLMPDDSIRAEKITDHGLQYKKITDEGGVIIGTPAAASEKDAINYIEAIYTGPIGEG